MSKITPSQILKENSTVEAKKLSVDSTSKFLEDLRLKQDFVLSLSILDEKNLKAVVRL